MSVSNIFLSAQDHQNQPISMASDRASLEADLETVLKGKLARIQDDYDACERLYKEGKYNKSRVQRIVDHEAVGEFADSNDSQGLIIEGNEAMDQKEDVYESDEFSPTSCFAVAYCEKLARTDNDVVLTVFAGRNRPVATPFDGTPSAKGGNLNGIIGACRSLVLQLYNSLGQYIDLTFLRDGKLMAGMKQKEVFAFSQTIDCMLRSIGKSNCRCRITIIMDNILIYECTPRQFSGLNQLLDDLRSTVRQCREGEFGEYLTYKWICVHSFFNRMIRSPSGQHLLRMGPPKAAEAQGSKKNNRGNVGLWNPHQYGPREKSRVQGLPNLERGEILLRTLCNDPSHIVNDRIYCERHSAQKDTPEREASKRVTCWSDEFQYFNWKSNGSLIIENTDPWGQMEPTSAHSWLLPYRNVEGLLENEIVLTFVPGLHNQKYDLLKGVSGLLRSITAQLLVRVKHAGELNYEDEDLLARVKSGHPDDLCDLFQNGSLGCPRAHEAWIFGIMSNHLHHRRYALSGRQG